ncbi:DUF5988 family protein [Micromonospora sp. NBC_01655]|uniref:DUF5988 family protein n=1 Tax=Micromonospora sp. NBC_01655 TaxID=2975983 RepID=UPI002259EDFC|nr:DUF5988 family protein [Micromonospora sp. NBC_01655]MCX4473467.1 DUF5988 family protein [Micromonospora sp. NBC_01655]
MTVSSDSATGVRTADRIVNEDDRSTWSAQAPIGGDAASIIDVVLEGGPTNLPTELRSRRISPAEDKIKVRHYGGYEHFERDSVRVADELPVVFRWTGRTRIAE